MKDVYSLGERDRLIVGVATVTVDKVKRGRVTVTVDTREDEPRVPAEQVEPFSEWRIDTPGVYGTVSLHGHVWNGEPSEALRYVDAIADGLRAAGFTADVTLVRETEVPR